MRGDSGVVTRRTITAVAGRRLCEEIAVLMSFVVERFIEWGVTEG